MAFGGTQIDDDAGAAASDRLEGAVDEMLATRHDGTDGVFEDVLAVNADGDRLAPEIADAERDMADGIGGGGVDDALRHRETDIDLERIDARHELLEALAILNEIR